MNATGIKLTAKQAEVVEWALDPMVDFWCTDSGAHDRDGKRYEDSELPALADDVLTLSPIEEINSDLLYRLDVQIQDMADSGDSGTRGLAKAGENVARKIRAAGLSHIPHGGGWINPA